VKIRIDRLCTFTLISLLSSFACLVLPSCGGGGSSSTASSTTPSSVAPSITTQPQNQTVTAPSTATFSVTATGTAPLSYQWNENGTAISGATSATYTTPATTGANSGASFTVVVTNSAGSVTSTSAILTVNVAASVTATAGSGQSATISTTFAAVLQATVQDASGNLIANATVTFTAPASGPSGTFVNGTATTTAITNSSGIAAASTFTANGTAGSYSVTASVAGVSTNAGFNLTNNPVQGVQISSLSETTVDPLTALTITGSGFNPSASAAISVLLTSESGNPPVVVPVFTPTATTIQIVIPPLFSVASGTFAGDIVDVQVIQSSGNVLFTSNVIQGLQVSALPAVPSGVATGAITLAFLEGSLNVSSSLQSDATTNSSLDALAANLPQYNTDINTVIADTEFVMDNPGQNVAITTSNGVATLLTQNTLTLSDQLILAYVTQFSNLTNQAPQTDYLTRRKRKLASARIMSDQESTPCPSSTGDASADNFICSMQQYAQTEAIVGGQAVQLGAKFLYGSYIGFLGGFAADALAVLGTAPDAMLGFQIIWSSAGSYVAAFGTASQAPTPCDLVESAGAQVFDNAAQSGVGVMSPALDAYNLYKDASEILTPSPVSPCAGPLLTAPQANAPSGTTAVNSFQTSNGTTTSTTLAAPTVQQMESTSAATIPPPQTFTLTVGVASGDGSVESFPEGILCGSCASDTTSFSAGASVALTATPASGESLSGWSGACSGIGPCVIQMNSDQTVTATFSPGQTYSGSFVAPFSGTFPDPDGDTYSASASGTIVLNIVQSNGTISGSASVPTYLGVSVASCPDGDCSTSSGTETAVGSVSGSVGSFGGTFVSPDQDFTITFTGSLNSSNTITGSATFSGVFFGTSDGSTIDTNLSGSVSSITLTAQ